MQALRSCMAARGTKNLTKKEKARVFGPFPFFHCRRRREPGLALFLFPIVYGLINAPVTFVRWLKDHVDNCARKSDNIASFMHACSPRSSAAISAMPAVPQVCNQAQNHDYSLQTRGWFVDGKGHAGGLPAAY